MIGPPGSGGARGGAAGAARPEAWGAVGEREEEAGRLGEELRASRSPFWRLSYGASSAVASARPVRAVLGARQQGMEAENLGR